MAEWLRNAQQESGARGGQIADVVGSPIARVGGTVALIAAVLGTFLIQAPVLDHYFFGDDFVSLADFSSRGTLGYVKDLFLLQDETPNWRFLTGLAYGGIYRTVGLDALPFLLTSLSVHTMTAGLIFIFVRRVSRQVWPALLAALIFGLTPASVPTVGQVTAFNNVLGAFLLMLALVTLYEGLAREQLIPWTLASIVAFAGAVAANDLLALLAPMPVLVLGLCWSRDKDWWRDRRRFRQLIMIATPFAIIGGAAIVALAVCDCTSVAASSRYGFGMHMLDNLWLFLGRLLYPVGMEPLGELETAHKVAGPVLAAVSLVLFVRGPAAARFAVAFLILALLPFLPLKLWSASRYVYLATIPFSMLAAFTVTDVARIGRAIGPVIPALTAFLVIGVLSLYGWQTVSQNDDFEVSTGDWRTLVTGLQDLYPELPEGSTVYVRGGSLWDEALLQCAVLPAVGEVIWGGVDVFFIYDLGARIRPGYDVFFADAREEVFEDVLVPIARPGEEVVTLVPQIPPGTTGNLCREDVPRLP